METETIRISRELRDELRILKVSWHKHSLNEVVAELVKRYRFEEIGALKIEVKNGDVSTDV